MPAITTHVLDTAKGGPAAGVPVVLDRCSQDGHWEKVGAGETDADGRVSNLMRGLRSEPGVFRLVFDTAHYFRQQGISAFYPSVIVVFDTAPGDDHYHVPLLLSPFGYSTYRGS